MTFTPILVAVGGGCGAATRYLVGRRVSGDRGTLLVNVLGSFALGVVAVAATEPVALLVGVGFCGAFTTFSSVAVRTTELSLRDASRYTISVAVAALLGALIGRRLGVLLGG